MRPLIRAHLFITDDDEYTLTLSMHHIVADGWSIGILQKELSVLYDAFSNGQEPDIDPLSTSYSEYALNQISEFASENTQVQRNFWYKKLQNPSTLELPTDRPRPQKRLRLVHTINFS